MRGLSAEEVARVPPSEYALEADSLRITVRPQSGAAFVVVGGLVVATALHPVPGAGTGLAAAFARIDELRFGRWLLGATGVGFMAFGAYSGLCAKWMKVHRGPE